jgi:hypothetical protein
MEENQCEEVESKKHSRQRSRRLSKEHSIKDQEFHLGVRRFIITNELSQDNINTQILLLLISQKANER